MLKLTRFKVTFSAKKVLSIFLIWTMIWLIILFFKLEQKKTLNTSLGHRISTTGCQIDDQTEVPKFLLWLNMPNLSVPKCPTQQFSVYNRLVSLENFPYNVNCTITPFKRLTDEQNTLEGSREISSGQSNNTMDKAADFFQLECFKNLTEIVLKDYGLLAPSVESKPDIGSLSSSRKEFSVLLLGLNKVTYADADVQLRHTMQFLRNQSNLFEFKGFNGLGHTAIWNMLAILTGRKSIYLSKKNGTFALDDVDFVWKAYSAKKFYTVFGENSYDKSLFNSPVRGFKEQPTDYYLRPFLVQIANDTAFQPKPEVLSIRETAPSYSHYNIPPYIKEKCKGSRHEQHIILELMEQFLPFYLKRLTFSFYWFSRNMHFMPHDDAAIEELLLKYKNAGIFDRTFLFIVSNVNCFQPKYRQQKLLKQPLLLALVPDDFKKLYPTAYKHFKANTERLTTPYDLHATLLQLADFTARPSNARKMLIDGRLKTWLYGISLFNETISADRTCRDANIPNESCLCHEKH